MKKYILLELLQNKRNKERPYLLETQTNTAINEQFQHGDLDPYWST